MALVPAHAATHRATPYGPHTRAPRKAPRPRFPRLRADGDGETQHSNFDVSVAVVGAGPVGLLTALALARRGFRKVRVLDRLPEPERPDAPCWGDPDRSYNLGLGGRGQRALMRFGAFDTVDHYSRTVVGRKDWSNGEAKVTLNKRRFMTKVIARDRLSSCLYQELQEKHPEVEVQFSTECTSVDFSQARARLELQRCGVPKDVQGLAQEESCDILNEAPSEMEVDLVLGCDGIRSAVRGALQAAGARVEQTRFQDRRPIVYRVLAIPTGKEDSTELNYSVRKDNVIVEALPNVEGDLLGVVLFRPTDERIEGLKSGAEAKKVFEELFPEWPTPMITDEEWDNFAARKTRQLPRFAYAGPELNLGGKCCLLGDAIHSVKPFFGLGLNSGFEDISVLDQCLGECDAELSKALPLYTRRRAPEAKCLVRCQRRFDQATDLAFALAFVLPIVLDSIFRKLLPSVFAPGLLALFQDGELSFTTAERRKRRDRILQAMIICGVLSLLGAGAFLSLRTVARLLWRCLSPPVHGWLHHELM
ncbi:unnamed protein product [Durusdinium trenchii]|uniref:FAD-binding domain-containing protein n=1 Tax=Durusdinium trenchii TaxID=1381693 RepID=A0ABP0LXD3_9DINO